MNITATVIIDPDRVGIGRLSIQDELRAYQQAYPTLLTESPWKQRPMTDELLSDLREQVGPLPIDRLDPMLFPMNWREIRELGGHWALAWRVQTLENYPPGRQLADIECFAGKLPEWAVDAPGPVGVRRVVIGDNVVFEGGAKLHCRRFVEELRLKDFPKNGGLGGRS